MGKNITLLLLIFIVVILAFICVTECKKHKDKKRHHRLLEHRHHHHRHHKHASGKHSKNKGETMKKEHDKEVTQNFDIKTLREQVRKLHEKFNKMLPRCKNGDRCPAGTCCWKGKCKMLPHRLNQRCSTVCPCNDAKKSMYCHLKKTGSKTTSYGRCYIKGGDFGIKGVNFIPETIEKLNNMEKRMMKGKVVEEKKRMKKKSKRNKKKGKKGRKHHAKRNQK